MISSVSGEKNLPKKICKNSQPNNNRAALMGGLLITKRNAEPRMNTNKQRLVSLDVFRGITIAGMILVNNQGNGDSVYTPLKHAHWNGLTPADLVFPGFIFIMGVALTLSTARRHETGETRRAQTLHILRRAALLFAIGFIFNFDPEHLADWRIMGVLQRLALVYMIGAFIVMRTTARGQAVAAAALLAGYWALMKLMPAPGFAAGDLSLQGNLAGYIDRALLGNHLYVPGWDPEGFLGTLPAVAHLLIGCLAGHALRRDVDLTKKIAGISVAGALCICAGLIMSHWFPINKNLWSPSFVFCTAGIAMLALSVCMWIVDYKLFRGGLGPFLILGTNSLLCYMLSDLVLAPTKIIPIHLNAVTTVFLRDFIYMKGFAAWLSPRAASLVFSLCYLAVIILIVQPLHKRNIFFKL